MSTRQEALLVVQNAYEKLNHIIADIRKFSASLDEVARAIKQNPEYSNVNIYSLTSDKLTGKRARTESYLSENPPKRRSRR